MHHDTALARLARDLNSIRKGGGNSNAGIVANLENPEEIFSILNTVVQWHGMSGRDLSDFECAAYGIAALDVAARTRTADNFLLSDADDIPPMQRVFAVAAPPLAVRFEKLLDCVPGFRDARTYDARQKLFALDDEDEADQLSERISAWTDDYLAHPFVSDPALIRHVNERFIGLSVQWPKC